MRDENPADEGHRDNLNDYRWPKGLNLLLVLGMLGLKSAERIR